ncbi:hypothetical protein TNCV_4203581 [Trichonephila clavipes]|uniref:Uncharacterized protein n=1 Tax=Trichonephila clavipes TaxID=2585209 RepID=A0A8X6V6W4_TRICX|nr:hypothetical protein TNCV_4203581 [Trichonephila clavipes]
MESIWLCESCIRKFCSKQSLIMSDLCDLKRGIKIVRVVGLLVSRTANRIGISRTILSRVTIAYKNLSKGGGERSLLADHLHPILQTFFTEERLVFQDDNAYVYTSRGVQTGLHEHDDKVGHLTGYLQSLDLNINEFLWYFMENNVHAQFPPPRTQSELETSLHKELVRIPSSRTLYVNPTSNTSCHSG